MFTGIVEALGRVEALETLGSNRRLTLSAPFAHELKIDQSVAHDGVCLTVTSIDGSRYTVEAVAETLARSTLGSLVVGDSVNLERSLRVGDRLDGHFVQGHVDATAELLSVHDESGSWKLCFALSPELAPLLVPKGSICLNGVSLTLVEVEPTWFSVVIIPYTWQHTTLHSLSPGRHVNVEADLLGKYLLRWRQLRQE